MNELKDSRSLAGSMRTNYLMSPDDFQEEMIEGVPIVDPSSLLLGHRSLLVLT